MHLANMKKKGLHTKNAFIPAEQSFVGLFFRETLQQFVMFDKHQRIKTYTSWR